MTRRVVLSPLPRIAGHRADAEACTARAVRVHTPPPAAAMSAVPGTSDPHATGVTFARSIVDGLDNVSRFTRGYAEGMTAGPRR